MTIREAVINVCNRLHPGDKLFVYEIEDRVKVELRRNNYPSRPTQETIQRRFREVADLCEMEYNGDQYVKCVPMPPLTEDEKITGQQSLFS